MTVTDMAVTDMAVTDMTAALAPAARAQERTVPVAPPLMPLLPDGALVRGRSVACRGNAAASLTLALAAQATTAGAWLAVVDVPWVGVEAAAELGVALERLVRVDAGPASAAARSWADLVAAVLDGFDVVVTRVPGGTGATAVRRVQARVRARGAVLLVVGEPAALTADVSLRAGTVRWEGVAAGHGHLRARQVAVEAAGRRVARPRRIRLWLPAPGGGVAAVPDESVVLRPVG